MSDEPPLGAPANTDRHGWDPFIPAAIVLLALLSWTCFQTVQLVLDRNSLSKVISGQAEKMEQSNKVRAALQSLGTRTARLAQGGNANATLIIEELRKRGITINPDQTPATPAP